MKHEETRLVVTACLIGLLTCLALPVLAVAGGQPGNQDVQPTVIEQQPAEPEAEAVAEAAPQELEPAADDAQPRFLDDPADLFGPTPTPASCCIDQCRKNKDCDAVCGAPGAGVCLRVNSCCRECSCTF